MSSTNHNQNAGLLLWLKFQSHCTEDILQAVPRDTGNKPDRMRRQLFRSQQLETYFIYQQDDMSHGNFDYIQEQAQIEYNCYLYAPMLGLNLPEQPIFGIYKDFSNNKSHMILANTYAKGQCLRDVMGNSAFDATQRDKLAQSAAYDATRVILAYGDNDRKPKNMIVDAPFTEQRKFSHVDFEYAMRDSYLTLIDNWFRYDAKQEFSEDLVLNRADIFAEAQQLLVCAEMLPVNSFTAKVVSNLKQAIPIVSQHSGLEGPSL